VNKLSLKMKLGAGFGALLLIVALLGVVGYESAVTAAEVSGQVERQVEKKEMTLTVDLSVDTQLRSLRGFLLTGNEEHLKSGEAAQVTFRETMDRLEALLETEEGKKKLAAIRQLFGEYRPIMDHAIELRRAGKAKEAVDLIFAPEADAKRNELLTSSAALVELIGKIKRTAQEEQQASEAKTKNLMLGLGCLGLLVGCATAVLIVRSITGPISRMVAVIQEIANKNLTIADLKITSEDEIGRAGIALNAMKNNLHEMVQSMRGTAEQVAASSSELSATSQQITANSEETTAQAKVVSEAGEQVNTNLQTLASGAEEMNSTIGEIAKNATEAARVAGEAVNQTVSRLGDSSVEIGKVIEVITSIAQQTNLLALNATIEAARAGEAGKGFAVVANEVKELAKQTAKATEEIKQKIGVIRENTGGAVTAIGGIKEVIEKISHISTEIATAVEEQSATTSEMARNVTEAARGATTISDNIKGVAEAAQNTSTNVGEAQMATEHLARLANLAGYIALTWLALRILPAFRLLLFAIALMPMTLHQAAGLSWDSIAFAIGFLFCALVIRYSFPATMPLERRDYAALLGSAIVVSFCKVDAVLLPLLLLIPVTRFPSGSSPIARTSKCSGTNSRLAG